MVVINVSEGNATGEDIAAGLLNPVLNSAKVFLPLHAINKFATFTAIEGYSPALSMLFNFLIFVVPAFMLFIVALIISRKAYYGAVASQLENSGRVHGGSLYKSGMSGFKAQIVREWKLIWRTPVFAIQCFGTLIIAPIILIVMGVGINGVGASPNKSMFVTIWLIIGALMQFLIVSTNIGASTTFSRDGEAFFINKLIPMSYNTLIKAKITLYNLIYDVAIVISTAIWYILFGLKFWWMGLLILAYLIIYNYGFVSMCILIDLSSPKLDWRSYREIVKNSRNAFLPILIGGAVSLLVGAASIGLIFILRDLMSIELASALVSTLMLGGAIAFAFITRNILSTNAARYFDRIEA